MGTVNKPKEEIDIKDKVYTAKEAAAILGVVPQTVARWCRVNKIGRKLGDKGSRQPFILTEEDIDKLRVIRRRGEELITLKFGRTMKRIEDDKE